MLLILSEGILPNAMDSKFTKAAKIAGIVGALGLAGYALGSGPYHSGALHADPSSASPTEPYYPNMGDGNVEHHYFKGTPGNWVEYKPGVDEPISSAQHPAVVAHQVNSRPMAQPESTPIEPARHTSAVPSTPLGGPSDGSSWMADGHHRDSVAWINQINHSKYSPEKYDFVPNPTHGGYELIPKK